MVSFTINKYSDEVLCDIEPMHAGHLLLGRPWQYNRRAIHDGYLNRFSFVKEGRKITLTPLCPKQVYKDQCKLESERKEAERVKNLECEKSELESGKSKSEQKESEKKRVEHSAQREKKKE